jgi:C4-dicarboxylate transporter DctM subunit
MTGPTAGLVAIVIMIALMFVRVPIGLAMFITGAVGIATFVGPTPILANLSGLVFDNFSKYSLSVIPIFLLMGSFASRAGLSGALYRAGQAYLGHRRGGLAMATVGACAGFGAICGSSVATAATMAQVALPEMKRAGYDPRLTTGTLAAGGTLGILIPPSIVLVIYAILAEQNIAKLFVAAFVPGIIAAISYCIAIAVTVRLNPALATPVGRASAQERREALIEVWPVMLIFVLVIGGMYVGWFTPTEGASVGAVGTGLLAITRGGMRLDGFLQAIYEAAVSSAMIFFIVMGAAVFSSFLAFTQLPQAVASALANSGLSPWLVLTLILLIYLALGCVMDSLSMILLTIPIFFPAIMQLDFGLPPEDTAIWFGIIALIVVEVGLITPPVGMNLFVINSMARDVPMIETYRGVLPFIAADVVRTVLLVAFPPITLAAVWLLY